MAHNIQNALARLFDLEKEIRKAADCEELFYILTNRVRSLATYDTAVLIDAQGVGAKVVRVSDVATIERHAPFIDWLEKVARRCLESDQSLQMCRLGEAQLAVGTERDREEWQSAHMLWLPLLTPQGRFLGAMIFMRTYEFVENEIALLEKVGEVGAHAWGALQPKPLFDWKRLLQKKTALVWALVLIVVQFIPVSQSVLAPAEVVAKRPVLVTAPMNGVVKEVLVAPNEVVEQGWVLMRFDATQLQGQVNVAEEELRVAESELMNARQAAFLDPRIKGEIAVLQSRMELRKAELAFARTQLNKIDVVAERSGVAVFRERADLEGVPVKTGQGLIQIAQPFDTQLRIELPVSDALYFEPGSQVRLFLDKSPLQAIDAVVERAGFEAAPTPAGVLSYELVADFMGEAGPRLGLRGTAKIIGEDVPLFLYLFRRPLVKVRQYLGI